MRAAFVASVAVHLILVFACVHFANKAPVQSVVYFFSNFEFFPPSVSNEAEKSGVEGRMPEKEETQNQEKSKQLRDITNDPFLSQYLNELYRMNKIPEYPRLARIRREQGRVVLRVQVLKDLRQIKIEESSGSTFLDRYAVEKISKWNFPDFPKSSSQSLSFLIPLKFELLR